MFKKNVWIVGLLAALAIMFAGCIDAIEDDDSGVEITVTDLQEIIKDAPVQVLNEDKWNAIFDGTPFKMCGEDYGKFEIIEQGGKKAIKVSQMTADWGVGFDARSASDPNSGVIGINFRAGDVITIKGSTTLANGITLNTKGESGMGKIDNWSATGEFDATIPVSKAAAAEIKAGKRALRIHGDGEGPGRVGVIILEEFKVVGKRGAGDIEVPINYNITGQGSYTKPEDSGAEYYLDLGLSVYSRINPKKFPDAKIISKNMTVTFNTNTQAVFVPFTDELKRIILTAKAYGKSVSFNIDGLLSDYFVADPIDNQIRCGFANDGGDDWNVTDLIEINTAAGFKTNKTLTWDTENYTVAKTNGFIIQARQDPEDEAIPLVSGGKNVSYTLTVRSIKIVVGTGGSAPTALNPDVTLVTPRTGLTAETTVSGANYTGVVKWTPEPADGKFARSQVYGVEITLTADPGYTFGTPKLNGVTAEWNAITRTLSNTYPVTAGFPELKSGQLYKLTTDVLITGNNLSGKDLTKPLENAGATSKYCKADGTTTAGDAAGAVVTGVSQNWHGITILLNAIDVGIDPSVYKVKVEVTGKVLAVKADTSGGKMRISSAAGDYAELIKDTADKNVGETFTLTYSEIRPEQKTNGNLRISNDDTNITSFMVTEITITNNGLR